MTPTEAANVAAATHSILRGGMLLPVLNLYGAGGQPVANPLHAHRVVAYNAATDSFEVHPCDPGEIWHDQRGTRPWVRCQSM